MRRLKLEFVRRVNFIIAPGDYILKLTAYDGEYYVKDPVTISVNPAPVQNIWL